MAVADVLCFVCGKGGGCAGRRLALPPLSREPRLPRRTRHRRRVEELRAAVAALRVGGPCRRSQAPSPRSDGGRGADRSVQLVDTCLSGGGFGLSPVCSAEAEAPCCKVLVLTGEVGLVAPVTQEPLWAEESGQATWRDGPCGRRGDVRRSSRRCGPALADSRGLCACSRPPCPQALGLEPCFLCPVASRGGISACPALQCRVSRPPSVLLTVRVTQRWATQGSVCLVGVAARLLGGEDRAGS